VSTKKNTGKFITLNASSQINFNTTRITNDAGIYFPKKYYLLVGRCGNPTQLRANQ
jgi:hypothetical protein